MRADGWGFVSEVVRQRGAFPKQYLGADSRMTTLAQPALAGVTEIDHALTSIERELDLLLNITPVNAADAWIDFERGGFSTAPISRRRRVLTEKRVFLVEGRTTRTSAR